MQRLGLPSLTCDAGLLRCGGGCAGPSTACGGPSCKTPCDSNEHVVHAVELKGQIFGHRGSFRNRGQSQPDKGHEVCLSTVKASRCLTNPPVSADGAGDESILMPMSAMPVRPSPGRAQLKGRVVSVHRQPCALQVPAAALTADLALAIAERDGIADGPMEDCWDSRYDEHEIFVLGRPGSLAGDTPAHDEDDVPSGDSEPPSPGSSLPARKHLDGAWSSESRRWPANSCGDKDRPNEPLAVKPLISDLVREPSCALSNNSHDFECADDLMLATASESMQRLHRDANLRAVPTRG